MRRKNWVSGIIAAGLAAAISAQSILPVMAEDTAEEQGIWTGSTAELTAEQENSMSAEELGYVPGEILIIYEEGISETEVEEKIAEEGDAGQAVIGTQSEEDPTMALVEINDETTVAQAVEAYQQDERVKIAIPNYTLETYGDGTGINDTFLSKQSYLQRIEAQGAWNILSKSSHDKVKVAVLDSGLNLQEEELTNILNLKDSVQIVKRDGKICEEPLVRDGSLDGHGTHVSGILAAEANNGTGIAGAGSSVDNSAIELIMVDVFEIDGSKNTTVAHLNAGLRYAKKQGVKAVNLSLGVNRAIKNLSDEQVEALNLVCQELYDAGITMVCAAGNDNYNDNGAVQVIPADFDNTIGVIALGDNDSRWSGSNYGDRKDVAAPGLNIYSTLPNGKYGVLPGTSMSAPMVTATVAMMYAADPNLTPAEVKQVLQNTATDLGPAGKDQETGYGLVNARKAVGSVQSMNFDDVWVGLWYYDPVEFVFRRGLMTGMNQRSFGATQEMSRAQYVTMLYRMQASPYVEYRQQFADVNHGTFYSDPVTWASASRVVTGYENGLFGTSDQITREQMALMLYRYAGYLGVDVSVTSDLSQFPDRDNVSGFAREAMQWATGIGVITGDGGRINPQGNASRAHCATMLQRMIEYYGLD